MERVKLDLIAQFQRQCTMIRSRYQHLVDKPSTAQVGSSVFQFDQNTFDSTNHLSADGTTQRRGWAPSTVFGRNRVQSAPTGLTDFLVGPVVNRLDHDR